MTRGKIIYIDRDGKIFSSVEFNGDMWIEERWGLYDFSKLRR